MTHTSTWSIPTCHNQLLSSIASPASNWTERHSIPFVVTIDFENIIVPNDDIPNTSCIHLRHIHSILRQNIVDISTLQSPKITLHFQNKSKLRNQGQLFTSSLAHTNHIYQTERRVLWKNSSIVEDKPYMYTNLEEEYYEKIIQSWRKNASCLFNLARMKSTSDVKLPLVMSLNGISVLPTDRDEAPRNCLADNFSNWFSKNYIQISISQ